MNIAVHRIEKPLSDVEIAQADYVLAIDCKGGVSCTKNRRGEIGVVCTATTPEALLQWVREQARYDCSLC